MVGWFCLLFISTASLPIKAQILITSMGKYFMVPGTSMYQMEKGMGSMIVFHLSTYSPEEFKVNMMRPTNMSMENMDLMLNKGKVTEYKVEIDRMYEADVGLLPAFYFEGPKYFGLSVFFMNPRMLVSAAYLAVPIRAWGYTYFITTSQSYPFIQVLSAHMDNKVEVLLRFASETLAFTYMNTTYMSGSTMMFTLDRYEAFSISLCAEKYDGNTLSPTVDTTTTVITGRLPVGVVAGNCYSKQRILGMPCDMATVPADMAAEMFLPAVIAGPVYVFPTLPQRLNPSLMSVMSLKNRTRMDPMHDQLNQKLFPTAGFVVSVIVDSDANGTKQSLGNFLLTSNEGIHVLYSHSSGCPDNSSDDHQTAPAMSILLPMELFYYTFVWKTPSVKMSHYLLIVSEMNYTADLMYDMKSFDSTFPDDMWSSVSKSTLKVITVMTAEGDHWLESRSMMKFTCYLYGFGLNTSYMYAAGFHGCPTQMESSPGPGMDDGNMDTNMTMWMNKTMDTDMTMWMNKTMDNAETMGLNKTMDTNMNMMYNKSKPQPMLGPYECLDMEKMTTSMGKPTMAMATTGLAIDDSMTSSVMPQLTTGPYFKTDPTFAAETPSKAETVPPTEKEVESSNAIYAIVLLLLIPLALLIYMSVRRQKATEDNQPPTPDVVVGPAASEEMPFVVVPDETHVPIDANTPIEVVRVRRLSGWGTSVDASSTPPKSRKMSTGSQSSKKSNKSTGSTHYGNQ